MPPPIVPDLAASSHARVIAEPALAAQIVAALCLAYKVFDCLPEPGRPEIAPGDPDTDTKLRQWDERRELWQVAEIGIGDALAAAGIDGRTHPACNPPPGSLLDWLSRDQIAVFSDVVSGLYGNDIGARAAALMAAQQQAEEEAGFATMPYPPDEGGAAGPVAAAAEPIAPAILRDINDPAPVEEAKPEPAAPLAVTEAFTEAADIEAETLVFAGSPAALPEAEQDATKADLPPAPEIAMPDDTVLDRDDLREALANLVPIPQRAALLEKPGRPSWLAGALQGALAKGVNTRGFAKAGVFLVYGYRDSHMPEGQFTDFEPRAVLVPCGPTDTVVFVCVKQGGDWHLLQSDGTLGEKVARSPYRA